MQQNPNDLTPDTDVNLAFRTQMQWQTGNRETYYKGGGGGVLLNGVNLATLQDIQQ